MNYLLFSCDVCLARGSVAFNACWAFPVSGAMLLDKKLLEKSLRNVLLLNKRLCSYITVLKNFKQAEEHKLICTVCTQSLLNTLNIFVHHRTVTVTLRDKRNHFIVQQTNSEAPLFTCSCMPELWIRHTAMY